MLYRLKTHPLCQIEIDIDRIIIRSVDKNKWSLLAIGEEYPLKSVNFNLFEPMYFEAYLNELVNNLNN